MMHRLFICLLGLAFAGCSAHHPFPGHDEEQVWNAMKAVAQSPDYKTAHYTKRWFIVNNFVEIDEENHVIEIDRELERILQRPQTNPLYEKANWIFTVRLLEGDPPVVEIENRSMSLPTKFDFEAQRYFADMQILLSPPMSPAVRDTAETTP